MLVFTKARTPSAAFFTGRPPLKFWSWRCPTEDALSFLQVQQNLFRVSMWSVVPGVELSEDEGGTGDIRLEENYCYIRAITSFYTVFGEQIPQEARSPSPKFYDIRAASASGDDALNLDKEVRKLDKSISRYKICVFFLV